MRKRKAVQAPAARVTLLIGTRKGGFILRGNKTRDKWKMQDPIMIGAVIHHMVLDPRDGQTLLMAARTGHLGPTIFRSVDGGETWQEASQPPAFQKASEGPRGETLHHNFWLSPGHASERGVWYAGSSPPGLFRSEDGGVTWEGVAGFNSHPLRSSWVGTSDDAPPGGATLHSIMIDPRDRDHIYFCLSGGGVFESTDKGQNWKPLNRGLISDFLPVPDAEVGHDPHCMRMHPLDPDRLYQQNHCGIYRMDRPEGMWVDIGRNLPSLVSDHSYPIVLHPRDPDTAWVFPLDGTFPLGRVSPNGKPATYVTRDAGATWKRQDKGFPKQNGWFTVKRQAMTADRHEPLGLYLGTTGGEIWASMDAGKSWENLCAHLPEIYSVEAAELS